MTEPIDRRRFLGQSLAAAIALELAANGSLAASTAEALLEHADPRMMPGTPAVPAAQNAYFLLERLAKGVTEGPLDDPLVDDGWEYEDAFSRLKPNAERDRKLANWADANPDAMKRVEEALAMEHCEYPRADYSEVSVETLSAFRSLARLMSVHANRVLSRGDTSEAARIVQLSADAFRRLRLGGGMYVDYLIASTCEFSLRPMLMQIAGKRGCNEELLRTMLSVHPVNAESKAGVTRSLQSEYCWYLIPELVKLSKCNADNLVPTLNPWLENLSTREEHEHAERLLKALIAGHQQPFDAEETAKLASQRTIAIVADLEIPWKIHREQKDFKIAELEPWPGPLGLSIFDRGDVRALTDRQIAAARKQLAGVHNPVGKKLVESSASAIDSKTVHRLTLREQARYDGIRIVLALAIYAKMHDRWPDALCRLCDDDLLDPLPRDAYSGDDYQYSAKDRVVWSVGAMGHNTPNSCDGDVFDVEELIWRLPAPH